MIVPPKLCLTCNKPVKGRTDKKFCDDYCRNNYMLLEIMNLLRYPNVETPWLVQSGKKCFAIPLKNTPRILATFCTKWDSQLSTIN